MTIQIINSFLIPAANTPTLQVYINSTSSLLVNTNPPSIHSQVNQTLPPLFSFSLSLILFYTCATMQVLFFSLPASPPQTFLATFTTFHDCHVPFLIAASLLFSSVLLLVVLLLLSIHQWRHPKDKRLPPGSMGWPYIGETLKLYTENPNSFFANRQKRYT